MKRRLLSLLACAVLAVPAQVAAAASGKAVYEQVCIACHATGVGNAPRLGDRPAWAPRLAVGRDGLVRSVIVGKGAMPPRAGNARLPDADIRAAVDYMLASVR